MEIITIKENNLWYIDIHKHIRLKVYLSTEPSKIY